MGKKFSLEMIDLLGGKYMTIQDFLDNTDDKELIDMCKECEIWKTTGKLPDGKFNEFCGYVAAMCYDKRQLEDYVLSEALKRFKDIVPILMKKYPE